MRRNFLTMNRCAVSDKKKALLGEKKRKKPVVTLASYLSLHMAFTSVSQGKEQSNVEGRF